MYRGIDSSVDIVFRFKLFTLDILSHTQITSNYLGQDLESREDEPTPLNSSVAPDFAHHHGDEVLHCPGAK
jgi:hypothetical protein